jgi:hypothetical protein
MGAGRVAVFVGVAVGVRVGVDVGVSVGVSVRVGASGVLVGTAAVCVAEFASMV